MANIGKRAKPTLAPVAPVEVPQADVFTTNGDVEVYVPGMERTGYFQLNARSISNLQRKFGKSIKDLYADIAMKAEGDILSAVLVEGFNAPIERDKYNASKGRPGPLADEELWTEDDVLYNINTNNIGYLSEQLVTGFGKAFGIDIPQILRLLSTLTEAGKEMETAMAASGAVLAGIDNI